MNIKSFFEHDTATFAYVISCPQTSKCAIIDSVLNFNMSAGKLTTEFADTIIAYIKEHKLTVEWILETHIHADHVTAASYLKKTVGGTTAIGEHIVEVLKTWVPILNISGDTPSDGIQFEHLFKDKEAFSIGNLSCQVYHTPGHTPACLTYSHR